MFTIEIRIIKQEERERAIKTDGVFAVLLLKAQVIQRQECNIFRSLCQNILSGSNKEDFSYLSLKFSREGNKVSNDMKERNCISFEL